MRTYLSDVVVEDFGLVKEDFYFTFDGHKIYFILRATSDGYNVQEVIDTMALIIDVSSRDDIQKFYWSRTWKNKAAEIKARDKNECQHCKSKGRYRPIQCVHHIKHLKIFPELALDNDNLIGLCNSCHELEHPERALKHKINEKCKISGEKW